MSAARESPRRGTRGELRLAVVGLGRLGAACARAVAGAPRLALGAIVRRRESLALPLPEGVPRGPSICEAGDLRDVDVALVCVPRERVADTVRELLSRGVPVVECSQVHAQAFRDHVEAVHREAQRHRCAAVLAAGWDPGALPLLRGWLALLVPKGRTETRPRASTTPSLRAT